MPNTCCVTNCKGNYDASNKVHVFSFPKEDNLRQKWINAIPRADLNVTKNTRVCDRHFQDGEIEFMTSFYNESTGETLTAKLNRPRLKEGAIPSIFPNCPKYLSTTKTNREEPEKKKRVLEENQIKKAVNESIKSKLAFDKKFSFNNLSEMANCFKMNEVPVTWNMIDKNNSLIFLCLDTVSVPIIRYAVVVNSALELNVCFKNQYLLKYKEAELPIKVSNYNQVIDVLNHFESESVVNNCLEDNVHIITSVLENLVDLVEDKMKYFIEFLIEQINLLKVKPVRYRYSSSMLIFSSLLYHISPQAYKFIRNSNNFILPDPFKQLIEMSTNLKIIK